MSRLPWGKLGLFAGGVLFGTAGIKILSSQDAKKCYTNATAAVLRAKEINAERAAADDRNVIGDAAEIADASAEATEE